MDLGMPGEDPASIYRSAERRLRDVVLGDGMYSVGIAKGEEARGKVSRELRAMREAFDALVAGSEEGRVERAEERIADLEEELRKIATVRTRRKRKSAE
jgi:hypothetical protein